MIYPSDYAWLPNSVLKGIDLPKIFYEEISENYGGYYSPGKIVVAVSEEELIPATIAHEFKHHLQMLSSRKLNIVRMDASLSYEKGITKYFKSSWSEAEALLFEFKHAKTWLNEWWYRKLVMEL